MTCRRVVVVDVSRRRRRRPSTVNWSSDLKPVVLVVRRILVCTLIRKTIVILALPLNSPPNLWLETPYPEPRGPIAIRLSSLSSLAVSHC